MIKIILLLCFFFYGCSSSPDAKHRDSFHLTNLPSSKLSRAVGPALISHKGESGYVPLLEGPDALASRIELIKSSEHTLDLQYYIWKNDLTGLIVLREVKAAADRGVRVRLLLDNLNESDYQKSLRIFDKHPHVEIRLINPFIGFLNHRMHNKAFIADNQVAIVGGRNIADEYYGVSKEANFSDLDVMLIGPVVEQVSDEFDVYWNSKRSFDMEDVVKIPISKSEQEKLNTKIKEAHKTIRKSSLEDELSALKVNLRSYWGKATTIYDHPSKLKGNSKSNLGLGLRSELKEINHELILISPYFIPGEKGTKELEKLRKRGVHIIVLTNSLASNDVSSVFGAYRKYRKELLEKGIEIYEIKPEYAVLKKKGHFHGSGSMGLHGKVVIVDRKKMFVGSMNMDARSRNLNTEMGVILENTELARKSSSELIKSLPSIAYRLHLSHNDLKWVDETHHKVRVFDKDPETTWWKRSKTWFLSYLIPEKFL